MNFVFVFILPSVFGFKLLYENIDKKNKFNLFLYECMIVLLSNLICTILVFIKNDVDCNIVNYVSSSMNFSIIYIILSIFIGCIIGFIITIIDKYLSINVEVKYEKKKSSKNSKSSK